MQMDVHNEGDIVLVELVGDIDGKTAPEFQARVLDLVKPLSRIVVSLERVAFMSSAGLRAMLLIYRQAKSKDAKVVLAARQPGHPQEHVRHWIPAILRSNVDGVQDAILGLG